MSKTRHTIKGLEVKVNVHLDDKPIICFWASSDQDVYDKLESIIENHVPKKHREGAIPSLWRELPSSKPNRISRVEILTGGDVNITEERSKLYCPRACPP